MLQSVQLKAPQTAHPVRPSVSLPCVESPKAECVSCRHRKRCLVGAVPAAEFAGIEDIVYVRRRVRRGETLFAAGDAFKCLYAIQSGFFKTCLNDGKGREQVTGFFMGGELLGLDGLGYGRFETNAVALEDSYVCAIRYPFLEQLGREDPSLQVRLHEVLAQEIQRSHGVMLLLGSMDAEKRVAAFLVNLSLRYARRGYSASSFRLLMTRDESGSYLGLTLETVSRTLSKFQRDGLLELQKKDVRILDIEGLHGVFG